MSPKPGGHADPKEIIGRDILIAQLWSALESRNILLNAERRMGKTSVLDKMVAGERPSAYSDWLVLKRDMEDVHSWAELASVVYAQLEPELQSKIRLGTRVRDFLSQFSNIEIKGFLKLPDIKPRQAKEFLASVIDDVATSSGGRMVVFLWDEVPDMIGHIAAREGEEAAMELLDLLRALRQRHPSTLRMVFTGSIGLHHVITRLKMSGYANSPVNDMLPIEVEPLLPVHSTQLLNLLLDSMAIDNRGDICQYAAAMMDHIPFYIHGLAYRLTIAGETVTTDIVAREVDNALRDPNNALDLKHFRDRVDTYYSERSVLALRILDILSRAESPVRFNDLHNLLQSTGRKVGREAALDMVKLLERDYYISSTKDGYRFRLTLIKRFWVIERGLE